MLLRRFSLVAVLALGGVLLVACNDDDGGGSGGGGGGGGDSEFCQQANEVNEIDELDPADPDAIANAIEQIREAAESAPDEIRDDIEVFIGFLEDLEEGNFDFDEEDQAQLEEATQNIEEFLADECGIEATDSEAT